MKADRRAEGRAGLDRIDLAGFVVHLVISHATDRRVAEELRNRTHSTAMQAQVRN
jgi:hypothetical protein